MLLAVLAAFVLAPLAPAVRRFAGARTGWVVALLPAALTAYFASFLGPVAAGRTLSFSTPWVPSTGINLTFYLDGLSLMFTLLVTGIGTLIVVYSGAYLQKRADLGRFMMFLLLFMGSMLGLVLADNVVTLFVFWELTSVPSFLLIGINHEAGRSRRAALQALVVTGGGGLALLAGLLLLAQMGGSLELSVLLADGELLRQHPWYVAALILVLLGAFTKSAQVPFHFWLPNAMEAPTPVSAYLHSATMVKAGVYLLARLNPGLGGTELWQGTLIVFGGLTFLLGAILALRNRDLKLILAQTTVASLGLLVFLIGIGSEVAIEAAMTYLLAHSLFKGALFMVAGNVDYAVGTRDVAKLSGLGRALPVTAVAAALAALSMAGLPPFIGFIAKEFAYKAALAETWPFLLVGVALAGNALLVTVAGIGAIRPFLRERSEAARDTRPETLSLLLGPGLLAAGGLLLGIFNQLAERFVIGPASNAIAGARLDVDLYLYRGLEPALYLSGVTVLVGGLFYLVGTPLRERLTRADERLWGMDQGYDQAMDGLVGFARWATAWFQTGSLHRYLMVSVLTLGAALLAPALVHAEPLPTLAFPAEDFYVWGIAALVLAGALAIASVRSRLVSILAMGVLGLSVAFTFLLFSAPDLAFTQMMVETLSVVILAMVIARLPVFREDWRGRGRAVRDGLIAAVVGGAMALLLLRVVNRPLDLRLSEYFAANSYVEAYGRNIVNVILVDFRALDTFGEIAVVVIAGVAVLSLLAASVPGRDAGRRQAAEEMPR
jgi:multicomponent Na+:H+ antiporter subunit A